MNDMSLDFSEDEIQRLLDNLDSFSPDEIAEIDKMAGELGNRKQNKAAYDDLIDFCKLMMPEFIVGKHHRILADMLMGIEKGEKDRVCVNIPPRHGKSQLVSIFYPAWFLGRNPDKKVMMVSHTTDLAVDFGRKVRNLIATDAYRSVFPTVKLAQDSKSAGRWNTNVGGEYYACGIGSCSWLVGVLTSCSLTIPILNKTLLMGTLKCSPKPTNGLPSERVLVSCRVAEWR